MSIAIRLHEHQRSLRISQLMFDRRFELLWKVSIEVVGHRKGSVPLRFLGWPLLRSIADQNRSLDGLR